MVFDWSQEKCVCPNGKSEVTWKSNNYKVCMSSSDKMTSYAYFKSDESGECMQLHKNTGAYATDEGCVNFNIIPYKYGSYFSDH